MSDILTSMYLLAVFFIIILPTIFTKIMCQHLSQNIRLVPNFSAPTHLRWQCLFTLLLFLKPLRFILPSYFSRIPKIRELSCFKMSWNYGQKQKTLQSPFFHFFAHVFIHSISPTLLSSPFCFTFTPLESRFHQASYFACILCSLGAQTHLPLMAKCLKCEGESTTIQNLKSERW